MTWEDLSAKWHDALPGYDIDRALQLARRLDELDDARELADMLRRDSLTFAPLWGEPSIVNTSKCTYMRTD